MLLIDSVMAKLYCKSEGAMPNHQTTYPATVSNPGTGVKIYEFVVSPKYLFGF